MLLGTSSKPANSVFHIARPSVADRISPANPKSSATGALPTTVIVSPSLCHIKDLATASLDLGGCCTHLVHRDGDLDLLDRLEEGIPGNEHTALDRTTNRRDDLGGTTVDRILVEFHIDKASSSGSGPAHRQAGHRQVPHGYLR